MPLNPALCVVSRHCLLFPSPGLLFPPCHDFWYIFKLTHSYTDQSASCAPPTEEGEANINTKEGGIKVGKPPLMGNLSIWGFRTLLKGTSAVL